MSDYQPDTVSPPGATLLETMQARSVTVDTLSAQTGIPLNTVRHMLVGLVAISDQKARRLEKALGVPSSFWLAREEAYRRSLLRAAMAMQAARARPVECRRPLLVKPKDAITIQEAAVLMGLSRGYVYVLCHRGRIDRYTEGRSVYTTRSSCLVYERRRPRGLRI